ncbi:hypothetical protein F4805DRAFT_455083 [Annulohypoxylon moriforme]|nr:hypothetical protein F4805DRAFT_455083 [Annulohypoxylon moriforme]
MADTSATAYLAYKNDTQVFLSWISQASDKCGWRSQPQDKAPKKVNKAKKNKNGKKKWQNVKKSTSPVTLTVAELVEQIEFVNDALTTKAADSMPFHVWKALMRSIKARERFSQWYKGSNSSSLEKLESHEHFIKILKKATCLYQEKHDAKQPQGASSNKDTKKDKPMTKNMFEWLEVEDLSESDEPDVPEVPVSTGPSKAKKAFEYNVEPEDTELAFAIFSLFEDINRMRAEAQRIFRQLMAHEITLIQATVSIAVTIDLVQRAEEEALKIAKAKPPPFPFEEGWLDHGAHKAFLDKLASDQIFGRKRASAVPKDRAARQEYLLLSAGNTLRKISLRTQLLRTGKSDLLEPFVSDAIWYKKYAPHMLEDPEVQKALEEERFLIHFYFEVRFLEDLKHGRYDAFFAPDKDRPPHRRTMRNCGLPFEDIFHSVLGTVWRDHVVSCKATFVARVLLDMHEICGSKLHGVYEQPKIASAYNHERYGFPKWALPETYLTWVRDLQVPDDDEIGFLLRSVRKRTDHDLNTKALWLLAREKMVELSQSVQKGYAENEKQRHKVEFGICFHSDDKCLLDDHPLYAGTALLDMITLSELAEIKIANYNFSIFCAAHIYNAAKLVGLDISWPEMERVIELQKDSIFANDIPTTLKDVEKRFMHRTGVSPTRPDERILLRYGTHPWMFRPMPVSAVIREYFNGEINLARMVHQLEEHAIRHEAKNQPNQSGRGSPTASTAGKAKRQVSLTKALHRVEAFTHAVLPDIQFNYLELTRVCNRLLASLKTELAEKLEVEYQMTTAYFAPAEIILHMVVENGQAACLHEEMRKKFRKEPDAEHFLSQLPKYGPQLDVMKKFLKKFLMEEAVRVSKNPSKYT